MFREFSRLLSEKVSPFPGSRVATIAALIIALCLFAPKMIRQVRATNYVEAAVAQHRSYLNGALDTGLRSSSLEKW